MDKFERLISDGNYPELEYIAECFMCALRDIMANTKQKPKKEILIKLSTQIKTIRETKKSSGFGKKGKKRKNK